MTTSNQPENSKPAMFEEQAEFVAACSQFCADWMAANPERLQALRADNELAGTAPFDPMPRLQALAVDGGQTDAFLAGLRDLRNEAMFIIAWRDLLGLDPLEAALTSLSALGDGCIDVALNQATAELSARFGQPRDDTGAAPGLIVIGMGKLGGRELNFSSDIDLVFAYREAGNSDGDRQLEAAEYYKRLARRLVQLLSEQTAEGFVFRVDTRLRPFGDSGPLVVSVAALESYCQSHGREWERYAWIKARPVAGDLAGGKLLLKCLRPFVYRRYLDYSAFESIREMKGLIAKQVGERGQQDNIKTGRGGIREVEFVVQAFQLIRGGHEPKLQQANLLDALARLQGAGHLPERVAAELHDAYVFLRRLENRLQMWRDRQTQELPEADEQRAALARAMGYTDWQALAEALADWRERVDGHFREVFAAPQSEQDEDERTRALRLAWADDGQAPSAGVELLQQAGFSEPEPTWKALIALRASPMYSALGERGERQLAQLVPLLVLACAGTATPDTALQRVVAVLERILGRANYLALLIENLTVLSQLVSLCSASPWISRQIQAQPVLLDGLLDPRMLYQPPSRSDLEADLAAELEAVDVDDLERRMDTLRRFQHEQTLRVAAADVSNTMPLMIVSDHLTDLAEVVVNAALADAWRELGARHGLPTRGDGGAADFAVIGYGKLGGLELGYGSDLDLVFVHEGSDAGNTDGPRPLSHPAFFLRLAQRVIHSLSTRTGAGRAYEVDMRLRPSGRSGLLVVALEAFEQYQEEKAWTWEHQALVRARAIAGRASLIEAFRATRARILGKQRDAAALRAEVWAMRERMRAELDRSNAESFDLKQGRGGLIDIEFIAQYAVLRWACDCEELLLFTDTIRVIETLESARLLDYDDTKALTNSYRTYRRQIHGAALQEAPKSAPAASLESERSAVTAIWNRLLEDNSGASAADGT